MKSVRERLQRVADRITGRKADLAKCRRREKVWRQHAEIQHGKQLRSEHHGHPLRATYFRRLARRSQLKAIYWKGRVRRDHSAVEDLERIEAHIQVELTKLEQEVHFDGPNRIRGGNYVTRAKVAQGRAMRNYRDGTATAGPAYYSMSGGARDYSHILFNYPQGRIYDCSTYADGTCFVTGDPSPSGPRGFIDGGWTGTELEHSRRIAPGHEEVGDLVVYLGGSMGSHHVERIYDVERKLTTGHGDSAINIGCNGSWDLFGDGNYAIVRPPRHEGD